MSRLSDLAALVMSRRDVAALQRNAENTGHPERAQALAQRKAEIDKELADATMIERAHGMSAD